jgi:hypothetical protein
MRVGNKSCEAINDKMSILNDSFLPCMHKKKIDHLVLELGEESL